MRRSDDIGVGRGETGGGLAEEGIEGQAAGSDADLSQMRGVVQALGDQLAVRRDGAEQLQLRQFPVRLR